MNCTPGYYTTHTFILMKGLVTSVQNTKKGNPKSCIDYTPSNTIRKVVSKLGRRKKLLSAENFQILLTRSCIAPLRKNGPVICSVF